MYKVIKKGVSLLFEGLATFLGSLLLGGGGGGWGGRYFRGLATFGTY